MKLSHVEPDWRYVNVDVAWFVCGCGWEKSALVEGTAAIYDGHVR
jgi:hypothetical protein